MILPSYLISHRTEIFYTKNKPTQVFVNSNESNPMFFNKVIAPIYLNVNNRFYISKQLSLGLNIGLFYDPILPFPDNIIKNKLNYSSHLILKYTF